MARISLFDTDQLPEPHRSAYETALAGRTGPRINIHRTVAHSPGVLVRFVELANELRNGTELDPRIRELVIVTVSNEKGATYESGKHWNLALGVGVSRDQLEAVEAGGDPETAGCFDEAEVAAIRLARVAVRNVRVDDVTWNEAARHFNERTLIEILAHIGMYSFTAHLTEAVQMDVENWFERK